MTDPPPRHLMLEHVSANTVTTFCGDQPERYDPTRHALMTAGATCPECLVIHAAWVVAKNSDLTDHDNTEEAR